MAVKFSDSEIAEMLLEQKPLPKDFRSRIQLRDKRGHKERELDVNGVNSNRFQLRIRQSVFNALDFSVILAVYPKGGGQLFRLCRYNGKSHEHSNCIEQNKFYDFHIHRATERYQELGMREDSFAEVTDRFSDYSGALRSMLQDCAFVVPPEGQQSLFEGVLS